MDKHLDMERLSWHPKEIVSVLKCVSGFQNVPKFHASGVGVEAKGMKRRQAALPHPFASKPKFVPYEVGCCTLEVKGGTRGILTDA